MIQVLVLEDDAAAAESSCRMLKQSGLTCSCERVEDKPQFRQALLRAPDVILSDSNVPGFDGLSALAIAQTECPSIPFIFVTGNPDPAAARVARERGAAGVVAKEDLTRLAGVVCTALDERKELARDPLPNRRKSETDTEASSTATYLIERQAILDRALKHEDRSALSNVLRRHPPMPIALLVLGPEHVRGALREVAAECQHRSRACRLHDRSTREPGGAHARAAVHRPVGISCSPCDSCMRARPRTWFSSTSMAPWAPGRRCAEAPNDCMPAEAGGEEFWAHLTTARRIASLSAALQLAMTDNRILSTVDELTRCGSRRFFEHEFPREVERAVRLRRPLSLLMCDIDHFKTVNDSHGHEIGDQVLREFAARLTQGLRLSEDGWRGSAVRSSRSCCPKSRSPRRSSSPAACASASASLPPVERGAPACHRKPGNLRILAPPRRSGHLAAHPGQSRGRRTVREQARRTQSRDRRLDIDSTISVVSLPYVMGVDTCVLDPGLFCGGVPVRRRIAVPRGIGRRSGHEHDRQRLPRCAGRQCHAV